MLIPIFSMVFVCLEFTMVIIVLTAFVIMLLTRYIYIAVLAILMPFAWLCWVFPNLNSHWKKWWSEFIRWTLFAPICIFFLYLSMATLAAMSSSQAVQSQAIATYVSSNNTTWGSISSFFTSTFTPIIANVLNMIVMLGLSVASLTVANSMGIKGADMGMKAVGTVKDTVVGYANKKVRSGARSIGNNISDRFKSGGKQYNASTRETTTWLQRRGSNLNTIPGVRHIPGVKGLGASIATATSPDAVKKGSEKDIQEYVDNNLKSLTNAAIVARATSKTAFANPTHAAALAQEIAKRDLTTHPDVAPLMNDYIAAADRLGNLDKVTANRPDLMPQRRDKGGPVIETKAQAIARAVKGAKADIIQSNAETFNLASARAGTNKSGMNEDGVKTAILSLSPGQLSAIGSDTGTGSQERQNNLTDAVKDLIRPHIVRNAQGKYELNSASLIASTNIGTPEQLKNLEKMVKHMESSNVWGGVLGN
jgi:hypothetical protein